MTHDLFSSHIQILLCLGALLRQTDILARAQPRISNNEYESAPVDTEGKMKLVNARYKNHRYSIPSTCLDEKLIIKFYIVSDHLQSRFSICTEISGDSFLSHPAKEFKNYFITCIRSQLAALCWDSERPTQHKTLWIPKVVESSPLLGVTMKQA